jgi:hypothetical protein
MVFGLRRDGFQESRRIEEGPAVSEGDDDTVIQPLRADDLWFRAGSSASHGYLGLIVREKVAYCYAYVSWQTIRMSNSRRSQNVRPAIRPAAFDLRGDAP